MGSRVMLENCNHIDPRFESAMPVSTVLDNASIWLSLDCYALICCGLRANFAFSSNSSFFNWAKSIPNLYLLSHLLLWASHCLAHCRICLLTFFIGLKLHVMNLSKLRSKKMRALTVPHLVARLRKGLMMHGWVLTLEGTEIPSFSTKNIETTWGDISSIDSNFTFLIDSSFKAIYFQVSALPVWADDS